MLDFVLVGNAKSGTTALDRFLSNHPNIYMCPTKESHFFATGEMPKQFHGPGDGWIEKGFIKDLPTYLKTFEKNKSKTCIGESSVYYLYYERSAERIRRLAPKTKILMILRNPIDRAYSAYGHLVREGRTAECFETCLELERSRMDMDYEPIWFLKQMGIYSERVKHYYDVFGKEKVKVLVYDDFVASASSVLRDVYGFLGQETNVQIDATKRYNESGVPKYPRLYRALTTDGGLKRIVSSVLPTTLRHPIVKFVKSQMPIRALPPMDPYTRRALAEFFAPDVRELGKMLERDLSVWLRDPDEGS